MVKGSRRVIISCIFGAKTFFSLRGLLIVIDFRKECKNGQREQTFTV